MARVFDQDQNNTQGGTTNVQQPQAIGAQGQASTSAPSQNKPAASGRFTNVQKFIKANRPEQFAGQIAGNVAGQAQNLRQNIGQAQQGFEQKAQAGRVDTAQNVQAVQDIYNPANTQQFSNILTSQGYAGPQGLEAKQALGSQAKRIQQTGQNLGNVAGRSQVVEQMYGRPTYSAGQKRLDTLLLGQDKSGALQQARAKTVGLENLTSQADIAAQQRAQQLKRSGEELISQAKDVYGKEVGTLSKDVAGRAQNVTAQRQKQYQELLDEARAGRLDADLMSQLGLGEGETLYTGPQAFLRQGQIGATAADVATAQEQAKMKTLADIAAKSGAELQGLDTIKQVAQAENVGKLGSLYDVNKQAFQSAQQQAKQKFEADTKELQDTQAQVRQLEMPTKLMSESLRNRLKSEHGYDDNEINQILNGGGDYQWFTKHKPDLANAINTYNQMSQRLNSAESALNRRSSEYNSNWGNLRKVIRR